LSAMSAAGGTLGELADMHTVNPTLYIEFAEGRIKLRGTVCSSGAGLLPVTFNEKHQAPLICKGDIRNIISFSEWFWIGSAESNPDEHPLPFPAAVRLVRPMICFAPAGHVVTFVPPRVCMRTRFILCTYPISSCLLGFNSLCQQRLPQLWPMSSPHGSAVVMTTTRRMWCPVRPHRPLVGLDGLSTWMPNPVLLTVALMISL
jgi:hypothetical protein